MSFTQGGAEARKKALLRKKAHGSPAAAAAKAELEKWASADDIFDISSANVTPGDKSWAAKRKEHIKSRANGGRKVTQAEVSFTAVTFAAKLKLRRQKSLEKLTPEERLAREAAEVGLDLPAKQAANEGKSWAQQRKENLMARSGHRPAAAKEGGEGPDSPTPTGGEETEAFSAAATEAADKAAEKPKEKTWAQKRKESYAKRHGQKKEVKEAEVTIAAVTFAAKLKVKRASSARLSAAEGSAATASEQV